MNMQRKDMFIYIIIALSICILIYFVSATNLLEPKQEQSDKTIQQVQLIITTPSWTINYNSTNTSNTTVADLLFECAEVYNISVDTEYYSGYNSLFITGINGTLNGENTSYWQYYINGIYGTKGCSNVHLHSNDIIEWQFEPSPW